MFFLIYFFKIIAEKAIIMLNTHLISKINLVSSLIGGRQNEKY